MDAELRTSVRWARDRLEDLEESGLLEEKSGAPPSFHPILTPETMANVEALAQAYRIKRVSVVSEIYASGPRDPRGRKDGRPS